MPPRNTKNARSNNKKKKGRQQQQQQHNNISTSSPSNATPGAGAGAGAGFRASTRAGAGTRASDDTDDEVDETLLLPSRDRWPDYHEIRRQFGHSADRPTPGETFDSVFERYQESARRFCDALRSKTPLDSFGSGCAVDLVRSSESIAQTNKAHSAPRQPWKIVIEKPMVEDLKTCIRIWTRAVNSSSNRRPVGKDGKLSRHDTFLVALRFCYRTLLPYAKMAVSRKIEAGGGSAGRSGGGGGGRRNRIAHNATSEEEAFKDRFKRISLGDQSRANGDDEDNFERELMSEPIVRPADKDMEKILIDIVRGDDWFRAFLFLATLDDLMSHNARLFGKLKSAWHRTWLERNPPLGIIEQLIGTGVSSNMTIEHVIRLEQCLIADHPHLDTVYRFLAVLVMPQLVQNLTQTVSQKSALAEQFSEKDAITYLGDCLECSFRTTTDPMNRADAIAIDFAKSWQIDLEVAEEKQKEVAKIAYLEEPLSQDLEQVNMVKRSGPVYQPWLPDSAYIGKNRSIVKTIRLLQVLSSSMNEHGDSVQIAPGFYGKEWDESRNRTQRKISGDLDQFLMGDIMPILIDMSQRGLLSSDLPRERELMPLFVQIKEFVQNPKHPVTWSLAFAIHSILTSVFEVQGAGDMHNLAAAGRQCYGKYFTQTEWAIQELPELGHSKHWEQNLRSIDMLRFLVKPPRWSTKEKALRALWNPLCGGTFLSYLTFFGNMDGGLAVVDSFGQLRVTLHLFNALIQVGAFKTGDMQLLDWMSQAFSSCKAIWEGPVPRKGQFLYRWLLAHGMSASDAKQRCIETRNGFLRPNEPRTGPYVPFPGSTAKATTSMKPEDLSKSFRRICLRDFSEAADDGSSNNNNTLENPNANKTKRRFRKEADVYHHIVRVNETLDAMEIDKRLLASNMWSLSEVLNKFFVQLFEVLELEPQVKRLISDIPAEFRSSSSTLALWETSDENLERAAMLTLFSEKVLGGLDFLSMPADDRIVGFAYAYMKLFFDQMQPDQVMYFLPVYYWSSSDSEEEEEEEDDDDDDGSSTSLKKQTN